MESEIELLLDKVSSRLREIRLKRDLSQEDFDTSEPQGISVPSIKAIEGKTKQNIELRTLFRFCRRTNIHPKDIFDFAMPWDVKALTKGKPKRSRATKK